MPFFQWLFQRLTGLVLFVGLFVHFLVMHYTGGEQIDYQTVMARLNNPLWVAFDLIFLLSVLYHGFNGLWGIVTEYTSDGMLRRFLHAVIVLAVIGLTVTGVTIITA
jgi:succinate dehydrogenase / fumarate reductase membrane anchor subunit